MERVVSPQKQRILHKRPIYDTEIFDGRKEGGVRGVRKHERRKRRTG